jgi:hypothetical protein
MLPDTSPDSIAGDERSVSEVVGVALLVGIVILGVATILLVGGTQLAEDQNSVEVRQAEQGLTQLDDGASRVATGETTSQEVSLGLEVNKGTLDVENDTGRIKVEYLDVVNDTNRIVAMETTMGTVVYESGDTTVGYQGGGVWRSDGNGSVMISPPEISYRGKTLTMPVVKTRKGGSIYSDVQVTRVGATERFPNATRNANLTNKVNTGIVRITIESRYYRAWGQFFEDETNARVGYPGDNVVVIVFFGSGFDIGEEAGIIATSGPGEIRIEGEGSYIDSYNSTEGPYSETKTDKGVVRSAGNIDMFGGSLIEGDAESEADILLDGGSEITGDACAGDDPDDEVIISGNSNVNGTTDCTGTVPPLPKLNPLVYDIASSVKDQNDNNETDDIQNEALEFPSDDEIELSPGEYYLEKIEMENNETLVLNATQGDFTIVVEDYVVLEEGNIDIRGKDDDGTVRMIVASNGSSGITIPGTGGEPADHFYVDGNSKVSIHNDSSPRFQVLAPNNFTGAIRASGSNEPQVTGVILAPTIEQAPSQFIVRDGELFGAVVSGNLTAENEAKVHFDRATLEGGIPVGEGALLDYLYLSENEIEVKGS